MARIIAGIGHKPDELEGYSDQTLARLAALARATLVQLQATEVITGLDPGWQQAVALAALELSLPVIAAIPYDGQDKLWDEPDRERWEVILFQAERIVHVHRLPEYYAEEHRAKIRLRDEWMVENSDLVVALVDEDESGIIAYAKQQNKDVFNVWNSWLKYGNI